MIISFLQKYWQYLLIAILGIALLFSVKSCKNQVGLTTLEKHGKDRAYHYATQIRLSDSTKAYRIRTLELTSNQLKGENLTLYTDKKKSDEQVRVLKIEVGNLNRIVALYSGTITMDQSFELVGKDSVVKGDTIPNSIIHTQLVNKEKIFPWHNKWMTFHGIYNPANDSLKVKYAYRADFKLVSYFKGKNLIKKGDLISDITFSDPSIQVGEFQGVVVKQPRDLRLSIGPAIIYDPFHSSVNVGISLQYSIIRF